MQIFSYKTAKLTARAIVEVDRRWVRATIGEKQTHIDYNLIGTINYWVTQSRGAALTGHLVIRDKQGRKLALQCSGFGMDNDFIEFLRAVSAILAAIGEARPDVRVAPEPTAFHRQLMSGVMLATVAVVAPLMYFTSKETDWSRAGGPIAGALLALVIIAFRFGPFRKKPAPAMPTDLARQINGEELPAPTAI